MANVNDVQAQIDAKYARLCALNDGTHNNDAAAIAEAKQLREDIFTLNKQKEEAIKAEAKKNDGKVVDNPTIDVSSEMGATFKAKVKTADQELIDETKKRSGKYNEGGKDAANKEILETYGYRDENGVLLTKDQAKDKLKELDKQKKQLENELKATQKAWEKAAKTGAANADELEEKYDALSEQYQEFKYQYDKDVAALRVNAEKKGALKGIRKAADHNVKNYQNVQDVSTKQAFKTEAEEKAYLEANPQAEGKTFHLEDNELRALKQLQKYGKKQIDKAQKEYDANPSPATEKKLKDAQSRYGTYTDMIDSDGNIDTKAVQNVLIDYAGGDQNLNLDEKRLLKKRLNVGNSNFVSEGDVKSLYDTFGFGTESSTKTKLNATAAAAGGALVGNVLSSLMGTTHSHKSASDSDYQIMEGETKSKTVEWHTADGAIYKTTITAKGGSAEAFASATAEACAKIPVLGQLAGPVLAGVTAFVLTQGKTEDAFNGAAVEEVLEDLSLVKNADNQAIINKIQDLPLDDRIKAAVLKASMGEGVTANTEELERAYQDLKKTQEAIGKIQVEEEDDEPEPIQPEPEPDPEPVEPEPEDRCRDIEERSSHSDVIPSAQVKGHGQSPYWIAKAYITEDGQELTPAQRNEVQKLISKEENRQVQETGNFNGSKIGYRYRNTITLKDGTVVKLADDAAKRIGTGQMTKTRVVVKNGKQVVEERTVYCDDKSPVEGPEGQWHTKK